MSKKITSIIIGSFFILAGILLMGDIVNLWNVNIFFKGWWTLFILVPSFVGLFNRDSRASSVNGLIIGGMLLIAARGIITWEMFGKLFLPIILILIGISIMFSRVKLSKKAVDTTTERNYVAIFSGTTEVYASEVFKGANITAVFGGVELDLRNAVINEDVVINCVAVLGGAEIFLPSNVKVKTQGLPILGGVENKARVQAAEDAPTVFINYTCTLGGIDIK